MASILMTGSTGFIGRRLTNVLVQAGHDLTLAVNAAPAAMPARARIVITGPLEKAANLDDALAGVDTVVHLAGLAHIRADASQSDPFEAANAQATHRLAQAAERRDVKCFIHLSSLAAITPNATDRIINDETNGPPPTPYGASKREAEKYVRDLTLAGIFAVSLRPPLVIGAEARGNWALLQRLAASGLPLPFARVKNHRSFIGIDTLASMIAHLSGANWGAEKSGDYCVADREEMSLAQVISELRKGMNLAPRLLPFPVSLFRAAAEITGRGQMADGLFGDLRVDASRFFDAFNFVQEKPLAESIRASGRDYAANVSKAGKAE